MEDRSKMYAVASQNAIPLAIYFVGTFFLMNKMYETNSMVIMFFVAICSIPILSFVYTRLYRKRFSNGVMSFSHAWLFHVMLYVFAGLLFAFFIYIYASFIRPDYISWLMKIVIDSLEQYRQLVPADQVNPAFIQSLELWKEQSAPHPIEIAMQSFGAMFNIGCLWGVIVAVFVRKKDKGRQIEK